MNLGPIDFVSGTCKEDIQTIIDAMVSISPFFHLIPFDHVDGNTLAYHRQQTDETFARAYSSLAEIPYDAEINPLVAATNTEEYVESVLLAKIKCGAKAIGRMFLQSVISGNLFPGLLQLCSDNQKVNTGDNGSRLSFSILDELIDKTSAWGEKTEFFMMPARTIRSYKAMLRAMSKDYPTVRVGNDDVISYEKIPIFRNDYISLTQKKGSAIETTTIFAGSFDTGNRDGGLSGLFVKNSAGGFSVEPIEGGKRIRWFAGLALFSEKKLALADGITG